MIFTLRIDFGEGSSQLDRFPQTSRAIEMLRYILFRNFTLRMVGGAKN